MHEASAALFPTLGSAIKMFRFGTQPPSRLSSIGIPVGNSVGADLPASCVSQSFETSSTSSSPVPSGSVAETMSFTAVSSSEAMFVRLAPGAFSRASCASSTRSSCLSRAASRMSSTRFAKRSRSRVLPCCSERSHWRSPSLKAFVVRPALKTLIASTGLRFRLRCSATLHAWRTRIDVKSSGRIADISISSAAAVCSTGPSASRIAPSTASSRFWLTVRPSLFGSWEARSSAMQRR